MEPSAFFDYYGHVSSLNPTTVGPEIPAPASLVGRAQAGDADAFGELCRIHGTRLLRQAVALCGNPTLAEDLAQDTLVDAWRCLHRYNGRCQFFTWLCAILLNRYRNVLRSSRQQKTSPLDGREHDEIEKGAGHLADDAARPDQAVERSEQAALVRRCIQTLPEKQQQVIYLRFYVDDSLDGVAAALGCSVGTVKSRLFYALDRLRQMEALNPQIADGKLKEVLL